MNVENTIIHLIGFPGVGKYTIAKEVARRADFILLDNHVINNPVMGLLKPDGKTPLSPAVWDNIEKIRDVVMDTIENIAPVHLNYVITNVVLNTEADKVIYNKMRAVFDRRKSRFISVFLHCEEKEHEQRIAMVERKERFKMTCPEALKHCKKDGLIDLSGPDVFNLDVTDKSPTESARLILAHVSSLTGDEK